MQMQNKPIDFTSQLDFLKLMYDELIPFNRILGFRVESLQTDKIKVRFNMRDDLIGNYHQKTLHGGVISSVLDATGGLNACVSVLEKMQGRSVEEIAERMSRVGTIDLRVDYLRPGRGDDFLATSEIMRSGNKVAVARMELYNNRDMLIAVGTGTYLIG